MERLIEKVENRIIEDIISGKYPPGSVLPLEREWAAQFGVGRPTLREALKKLENEGWIRSKKGSASIVNDYIKTGNIEILARLAAQKNDHGKKMARHFLDFRALIAPVYFDEAVRSARAKVIALLSASSDLEKNAEAYTEYDWKLQTETASLAGNPAYRLLLNSFETVNREIGESYFSSPENRTFAGKFFEDILKALLDGENEKAVDLFEELMIENANRWIKSG